MSEQLTPVSTVLASGAMSTAVTAVFYVIVGKFLLPKWLAAREEFERETVKDRKALREECTGGLSMLREKHDDDFRTLERKIDAENLKLRELWHQEAQRINVIVGNAMTLSQQNEKAVATLVADGRRTADDVHKIDKEVSKIVGTMQGVTTAVDALAAAIKAGRRGQPEA